MKFKSYNIDGIFFTGLEDASQKKLVDKETKKTETVLGQINDTFLITQHKRTEDGINCVQWYDMSIKDNRKRWL